MKENLSRYSKERLEKNKKSAKKMNAHLVHLEVASSIAKLSGAERRKVGAVLVTPDGRIAGTGYNGTPFGVDNACEYDNVTLEHVIHAEVNAILNARTNDLEGSTMYVTLSPCVKCAAVMLQKKITTVIYDEAYRDPSGINFLKDHGVEVFSISDVNLDLHFAQGAIAEELRNATLRDIDI